MKTQDAPQIDQLGDRYDIIGELAGRGDGQLLIARERESGEDAQVFVTAAPAGDQGNALSHLAADVQRLAGLSHRAILPVREGRWLGDDHFAVITAKPSWPTLSDLLIRREEAFACPRIATILQDVNAALEWAREQRIVHRNVDPRSIFLEPGSDRAKLFFTPSALPLGGVPGAHDDARTIVKLARAMLTRSVADPERDSLPLGELRPGLPDRLLARTEEILNPPADGSVPDLTEYIAIVAMSDNLKRAEIECAETTAKLLEEERMARDKLDAERRATEEAAAEQARLFQLEREEFAKEKEGILAELQKQREEIQHQREQLAAGRADHERDRQLLLTEREEHRRWADEVQKTFEAQKKLLETQRRENNELLAAARAAAASAKASEERRVAAEQAARRLAAEAAELAKQARAEDAARLAAMEKELAEQEPIAPVVLPRLSDANDPGKLKLPARPKKRQLPPEWQRSLARSWTSSWARRPRWNSKWNVPAAAVALVLLIGVVAVALTRGASDGETSRIAARQPASRVVDSAAGGVTTPSASRAASGSSRTSANGLPADFVNAFGARRPDLPPDFVSGVQARLNQPSGEASGAEVEPTRARPTTRSTVPVQRTVPAPTRQAFPAPVDTTFGPPITQPEVRFPPVQPLRPDTLIRPRPDTLIPDTLQRSLRFPG